jgi:hypothetical protein
MTRRYTTFLTLSVIAALVAAINAKAASTSSIPIRLYDTEAPVVMVRIQGKDVPLQLDLGDVSSLVLHPEVLATLRSEPTGDTFKAFSMDGEIETPIVRLDLIEIGGLKLYGVAARKDAHSETFLNNKKTMVGALGFIGAGLFKSGQLRLDYPRTRLAFSLPSGTGVVRNICRGQKVPFVTNQYGFTTPVSTDIGELQLGWDSGSPAILVSQTAAAAAHLDPNLERTESKTFIVGGKDFGPQRIEIWNNIPLPKEIAGLIGYPFFQKHVVCFDYSKRMLHVQ